MEYDRAATVAYAKEWAYRRNPRYYDFSQIGGNCTNFASQCIYAGARIMNYTPLYGWYYRSVNDRTPSWTGVEELYRFLTSNRGPGPQAISTKNLREAQNGDVIQLKFNEGTRFDHTPVVIDAGEGTANTIMVAANSDDSDCRPLSTYRYIDYRVLHIVNVGE